MIINLDRFAREEKKYWDELEGILDHVEKEPGYRLTLEQLKRFHYLYRRTSSDLANIRTFSAERDLRHYLESLVGRAFAEIHQTRERPHRLAPLRWFFQSFPQTFRRHILAFWLSFLITCAGFAFGGAAISIDKSAKDILMPFQHLQVDPSERVQKEESAKKDRLENRKASFSSFLMTHNIKVSIATMALGITWGIGTIILLFTNGVMVGAVALDYILAGETKFLMGWLLPHGSIEIPAILIAGQAGLILAGALIGWGKPVSLRERMRAISRDLVTLVFGLAVMLVWAGIVEAFLSQYHEPVINYNYKIGLGFIELTALILFLMKSGKSKS
jgi:uncharacterized membrane protein SpoIIM required for sporulation